MLKVRRYEGHAIGIQAGTRGLVLSANEAVALRAALEALWNEPELEVVEVGGVGGGVRRTMRSGAGLLP